MTTAIVGGKRRRSSRSATGVKSAVIKHKRRVAKAEKSLKTAKKRLQSSLAVLRRAGPSKSAGIKRRTKKRTTRVVRKTVKRRVKRRT